MTPAKAAARLIVVVVALLLPTASLAVLGGLYLWEKGWMLWWGIAALTSITLVMLFMRWLLPEPASASASADVPRKSARDASEGSAPSGAQMMLSPGEMRAWNDVRAIAAAADVESLTTLPKAAELAQRTIEAVAARLHPQKSDAIWQFTLPEAFAIIERVSDRLGYLTETRIPFGDRLAVAQVLAIYRRRGLLDVATRAYDVWRLVRMANPAMAATQEARERLSKAMLVWGRDHIARRLVEAYVEEVGRAAIDLYGGRLASAGARRKLETAAAPTAQANPSSTSGAAVELDVASVVVVGASAKRDAVTQSLAQAARRTNGPLPLLISKSDAIATKSVSRRQLLRDTRSVDVAVWIFDASATPTVTDLEALAMLRAHYHRDVHQIPPALIILGIGKIELSEGELVRRAGALAQGLLPGSGTNSGQPTELPPDGIDEPGGDAMLIAPFAPADPEQARDAARVIATIASLAPEIAKARALRELDRSPGQRGWFRAGRQAVAATGALTSSVFKRGKRP